ncbi:LLM class flavin-dependent oxidoreductase [Paenibacillus sp.]|uniref:LLM class flavin-dependent oxidoreductase n=1 Tax=Paenibacillus sp. TaxID=58172 RepID=UPI0028398285|nr:LLM class flavin-dependent oxidoreductase [Paenibacillus sp.]MDR0267454.1 LLM class flavin-dependent oxidoreductase [Paenibacillus sp.]
MIEYCWVLPVSAPEGFAYEFNESIVEAKLAEASGFDQVLVSILSKSSDPWVLAANIARETEEIRILVAQNTNFSLPTITAKAANTLNETCRHRIDLNIVTGSVKSELAKDIRPDDHGTRYRRTKEFVELLKLLQLGDTTYTGEFYQVVNNQVYPAPTPGKQPRIYVAGASEEAMSIAAHYGDTYVMYASPTKTAAKQYADVLQRAAEANRSVSCSIYIDIIARPTSEQAWEAARGQLSKYEALGKKMNQLFYQTVDSVGHKLNKELAVAFTGDVLEPTIWSGRSLISSAAALSIVGSYQEVIETLKRYQDAGATSFILTASCLDQEMERLGEYVLPYAR